ncbi:hypothetical protein Scep_014981 [Stephania cephalantha]|uniref:Uncharacterized protein n=1 Tax=Stephania cephalantha TaxID=152367 RepID=A0AAP0J3Q8_9MAGN
MKLKKRKSGSIPTNERVELGAREALVDVQDESELIMIDSSHSEDTIEESSDRTIKDKDVLREFDDDEEEIKNEDKSMLEMEKIKDSTKNAMRPSEDSIVEISADSYQDSLGKKGYALFSTSASSNVSEGKETGKQIENGLSFKGPSEERGADMEILRTMAKYLWLRDNLEFRWHVVMALGLLIGGRQVIIY